MLYALGFHPQGHSHLVILKSAHFHKIAAVVLAITAILQLEERIKEVNSECECLLSRLEKAHYKEFSLKISAYILPRQ
jgi:hypothetical protein